MKFEWIEKCATEFDVLAMCAVLEVSRAGYYAWLKRPISRREQASTALDIRIEKVFVESRETYGSLRVFQALKKLGVTCGENRVARRMQQINQIISTTQLVKNFRAIMNYLRVEPLPTSEKISGALVTGILSLKNS